MRSEAAGRLIKTTGSRRYVNDLNRGPIAVQRDEELLRSYRRDSPDEISLEKISTSFGPRSDLRWGLDARIIVSCLKALPDAERDRPSVRNTSTGNAGV